MATTIFSVNLRNAEAARLMRNLQNQALTITYTFTASSTADLGQGIIGVLSATTAANNPPPEIMPVGTLPTTGIAPQAVSN